MAAPCAAQQTVMMVVLLLLGILGVMPAAAQTETINYYFCNSVKYNANEAYGPVYGQNVQTVVNGLIDGTRYADNYDNYRNSNNVWGHATCSGTIDQAHCYSCLITAEEQINKLCVDSIGAQVGLTDCAMRYENYQIAA